MTKQIRYEVKAIGKESENPEEMLREIRAKLEELNLKVKTQSYSEFDYEWYKDKE